MIVVSNTSPICYLVLIGEVEILPRLFGSVQVPKAVSQELSDPGAPSQSLLDLDDAVSRLLDTNFRIDSRLVEALLERRL